LIESSVPVEARLQQEKLSIKGLCIAKIAQKNAPVPRLRLKYDVVNDMGVLPYDRVLLTVFREFSVVFLQEGSRPAAFFACALCPVWPLS
jgi:hypothetical protein